MKNYVSIIKLFVLLGLAPVAIYTLSISDTIGLYKEYRKAGKSVGTVATGGMVAEFPSSAPMLNSGTLMGMISGVCVENNVLVDLFSPKEIGREGALRLVSAKLKLMGEFVGLLKVLACIEDVPDIKLNSVKFSTVKSGKNGKTIQLELTLLQMENDRL